jgi:hypothetical protein
MRNVLYKPKTNRNIEEGINFLTKVLGLHFPNGFEIL